MFKYLWIIVLVILGISFIAYTIWAVMEALSENDSIYDAVEDFAEEHTTCFVIWVAIIIIITFISAYQYATSKGAAQL